MAIYIYKSLRGDVEDNSIISRGDAVRAKLSHYATKLFPVVMLKMIN